MKHSQSLMLMLVVSVTGMVAANAADQQQVRDKERVQEQQRVQEQVSNPGTGVQQQTQVRTQAQEEEMVYGSQLMTPEERQAFRLKMRSAKTLEEREAIRLEHHRQMQERAKSQGLKLPDEPLPMGGGQGGGMGQGWGRNR